MDSGELKRLSAFTDTAEGGNPAGVWIGDELPTPEMMQQIAIDVGYSETAFIAPRHGRTRTIRYYSPAMEVPFCGHATIASGVVLAGSDGEGEFELDSAAGRIRVSAREASGRMQASLTSATPEQKAADAGLVGDALEALHWSADDLDLAIPPILAYAGAWHLVLAVAHRDKLDALDYDFDALKRVLQSEGLVTAHLVWRERGDLFHSRNPFPTGGVVEDPATGAAAAAFGGYLRDSGLIKAPATIEIRQGEAMGRPSLIRVSIPLEGGIVVTGAAVAI